MVELERVIGFQWDDGNERKSYDRHGVNQAEAEQIFYGDRLRVVNDFKHSRSEARFHALGMTDKGRALHVTFTLRANGTKIRVISARDMSRKERRIYEDDDQQETGADSRVHERG